MTNLPFTGGTVSGDPEAVARAVKIDKDMAAQQRAWIAQLRADGVKAAHPDDGWVDREKNAVSLCYPQFNDGLDIGDRLALGWPWHNTRIVRIVDSEMPGPIVSAAWPAGKPYRWYFEAE